MAACFFSATNEKVHFFLDRAKTPPTRAISAISKDGIGKPYMILGTNGGEIRNEHTLNTLILHNYSIFKPYDGNMVNKTKMQRRIK
jgi:hypothetical protein